MDVFLCCEAEFKAVLILGLDPSPICKPPLDPLLSELLDKAIKLWIYVMLCPVGLILCINVRNSLKLLSLLWSRSRWVMDK